MNRRFLPLVCQAAFVLCAGCGREGSGPAPQKTQPAQSEAPPALAGGQATFELELLRAPLPVVAETIFAGSGHPGEDAALRDRLLEGGATSIVRCTAAGEADAGLVAEKVETTLEPLLFACARLWQDQAAAMKTGKEIPVSIDESDSKFHKTGYTLRAFLRRARGGIFAEIDFLWAGPPAVRKVNTWPVKDKQPRIVQDRNWNVYTILVLPADKTVLLAAAPEPPDAEGKPTGFALLAFGKAAAGAGPEFESKEGIQTIQTWTFGMPAAAAHPWLSHRQDSGGDEAQFRKLLSEVKQPQSGTALIALETLRQAAAPDDFGRVDSRLTWSETRSFERADIRYVKFVPVPIDAGYGAVAHRLECREDEALLTLPADGVQWKRWHGSTRGPRDEPEGVESSLTGSSEGGFFTGREPGRIFLANAHTSGANMRLTFARTLAPAPSAPPSGEYSLTILETPPDPWLPRLAGGVSLAALLPELTAAAAAGTAVVLHQEVCAPGPRIWLREATYPWLSFAGYIKPSIHDGKLCFNPGAISGSAPACRVELDQGGRMNLTVRGEPVSRHFGLWLPELPDYSAQNSGVSLSEWPHLQLHILPPPPLARDVILAAGLGRSWRNPEQRALHWFIARHARIAGRGAVAPGEPSPPPEPVASFTLSSGDGTVLEHITLAGKGIFAGGRQIQSLRPREVAEEHYFEETIPEGVQGAGNRMSEAPGIVQTLDGLTLEMSDGRWAITHSLEPARKIAETLTGQIEQPVGADFGPGGDIPVSCERLVLRQEKLTGTLPAPGTPLVQSLEGGRRLTVSVR